MNEADDIQAASDKPIGKPDYRQAVGAAPGFLGDQKPEDVIRKARGGDAEELEDEIKTLRETNNRLNRHCQELEEDLRKYCNTCASCGAPIPPLAIVCNAPRQCRTGHDPTCISPMKQLEILKAFVREVVTVECWGYEPELDGGSIQDLAEKLGIITRKLITQEQADEINERLRIDLVKGDAATNFVDWMDR